MLQNIIVLTIWFSCIYKQNIISIVLFVILVIYSQFSNPTTMFLLRTSVSLLIVVQYCIELLDLSSYNSPKKFPTLLLNNQTVYPNAEQFYYNIPILLSFNATKNETTGHIINSTANLNVT